MFADRDGNAIDSSHVNHMCTPRAYVSVLVFCCLVCLIFCSLLKVQTKSNVANFAWCRFPLLSNNLLLSTFYTTLLEYQLCNHFIVFFPKNFNIVGIQKNVWLLDHSKFFNKVEAFMRHPDLAILQKGWPDFNYWSSKGAPRFCQNK